MKMYKCGGRSPSNSIIWPVRNDWMANLSTCLLCPVTHCEWLASSTKWGRPFAKVSKLVVCFGGVAWLIDLIFSFVYFEIDCFLQKSKWVGTEFLQLKMKFEWPFGLVFFWGWALTGDFFKDQLPKADLYILARILHDWTDEKVHALLRKISDACTPGKLCSSCKYFHNAFFFKNICGVSTPPARRARSKTC